MAERSEGIELVADCSRCFALCCVALPFTKSADFAFSKSGGEPCRNLENDFRCGVHDRLRPLGMPGCTVYDCFGAGQAVSQQMYDGRNWRDHPETRDEMFEVFASLRRLHEMLFYLESARRHVTEIDPAHEQAGEWANELADELDRAVVSTGALAQGTPYDVLGVDVDAHRLDVAPLLRRASASIRENRTPGRDLGRVARDDLAGQDLGGLDLRSADLRGKLLIGADLSGADLSNADLLGADLRATVVRRANLTDALFLTQMQVNAAHGDAATRLDPGLTRPGHWN